MNLQLKCQLSYLTKHFSPRLFSLLCRPRKLNYFFNKKYDLTPYHSFC